MAHDVFISYAAEDKPIADACCARLEAGDVRCWMAPRDVVSGTDWSASIIDAIAASKVLVLVFSEHSNDSAQVKREVERAVSRGLAVLPVRIQDVPLSKHMEYFISTPHWLDAMTPPLEAHLERLVQTARLVLGKTATLPGQAAREMAEAHGRSLEAAPPPAPPPQPPRQAIPAAAAIPERPIAAAVAAIIVGILGVTFNFVGSINLLLALTGHGGLWPNPVPRAALWLDVPFALIGLLGGAVLIEGARRAFFLQKGGLGCLTTVSLGTAVAVTLWFVLSVMVLFAEGADYLKSFPIVPVAYFFTTLLSVGQLGLVFALARRAAARADRR